MAEPTDIVAGTVKAATKANPVMVFLVVIAIGTLAGSMWFEVQRTSQIVEYIKTRDARDRSVDELFKSYLEERDTKILRILNECVEQRRSTLDGREHASSYDFGDMLGAGWLPGH